MTELSQHWDARPPSEEVALWREIAELKAEIRARFPRLIAVNMASMIATAGLVLAAAKWA